MASQQEPYSPKVLPPKADQTGDRDDSGLNIEYYDEPYSDNVPYGESPNRPNSSRDEKTRYPLEETSGNGSCVIVIGNNKQQPTKAKHVTPDTISKDQESWQTFLDQRIDHFITGGIFEVRKEIFPGSHLRYHSHDPPVSLYVRKSFKPLFEDINKPLSSSSPLYIITGTVGVGISSFGFYLLRHLIETISPGESILYQYTIGSTCKYVKIMCTGTASDHKSVSWNVTCYNDTELTANLESDVSWYVCDEGKLGQFKLPTILIRSSPLSESDICRLQANKRFIIPLWKWEEVEEMLKKVYPVSCRDYLAAKEKNHTIFIENKHIIFKAYLKAIQEADNKFQAINCRQLQLANEILTSELTTPTADFCNSMRMEQLDSDLKNEKEKLSTAARNASKKAADARKEAHITLQRSYTSAKETYLREMEAKAREFCKQTEELEDKKFPHLSDARWAYKHIGKLPSTYLYTTKSNREERLKTLDQAILSCLGPLELLYVGKKYDLPQNVSSLVLHVSCDYDEENAKFKFTTPYLVVASPYVYDKLFTPMTEGRAVLYFWMDESNQLTAREDGRIMLEPATHILIRERARKYKAHALGTYTSPHKTPKDVTLDLQFKDYKTVKTSNKEAELKFKGERKWRIEIKPEERNCYCQPDDLGFPAIDSLIPSQKYLFQVTRGNGLHSVKTRHLHDTLTQLGWLDDIESVKLIFLVRNKKFIAQEPAKKDEDSKMYNDVFAKIQQYRLVFPQNPWPGCM